MASPLEPVPFVPGVCIIPGAVPGPEFDTQAILLCDILDGNVVGSALAVYVYDEATGAPVGPPTFVDPATGAPYVVQGALQPCPSTSGGAGDCCDDVSLSAATLAVLENIVVSGTVALDAPTLAALEEINAVVTGIVSVDNFPASFEVSNDAGNPLPVSGTVALDATTLAALETINALVSGTVALDAPTLAALETINAVVSGTVALDAPTLAALENIIVSGTVALDAPTLAALEDIVVSGTVELGATTLAALETINAVVSGTVALDAPTLAALESIIVSGTVALDAPTLAALENIVVSGTVALDAGTLAALETINANVSGTVALDAPTLAALENIVVSGTVELGAATLAALENITVTVGNFPAAPTVKSHHFDVVPGTPWTTAAIPVGRLVGLSYAVLAGTVTTVDADGTSIAAIPTGYAATWSAADDDETLTPPASITAAALSRALVLMSVV